MGERLRHPIAVWLTTELVIVLVVLVGLLNAPAHWELRPFPGGTSGHFNPTHWSPDGGALILEDGGYFDVIASDGSVLLANQPGWSPVWVAEDQLLVLEELDERTNRLAQLDLATGRRQRMGESLAAGRLYADGRGRVAHHDIGAIKINVLDPDTGHVLHQLGGYLPRRWTDDGELIIRQRVPGLENAYPDGGWLLAWKPGGSPRLPAPDLIELAGSAVLSPDGDALACICMPLSLARAGRPLPDVYRIPLDGSEPTTLMRWRDSPLNTGRVIAWRSSTTVEFLDSHGVALLGDDGQVHRVLDVPQADPIFQSPGRIHRLDGAVAVVTGPLPFTHTARVIVVDDDGRVRLSRQVESWNLPHLVVDPSGERAIVSTDPNLPGESPVRLFLLALG